MVVWTIEESADLAKIKNIEKIFFESKQIPRMSQNMPGIEVLVMEWLIAFWLIEWRGAFYQATERLNS